jgi:predicted kinase
MPTLFIFSGLPGTGKTTLARRLAQHYGAVHLRIDTIEQTLRDLCRLEVTEEGYRLAYRIAADNLQLGLNVLADSCNPIELTRRQWERVARAHGAQWVNIEVTCTDIAEHRQRVESRSSDIDGLRLPTWQEVLDREYHPWSGDRIIIDTSKNSVEQCLASLFQKLLTTL